MSTIPTTPSSASKTQPSTAAANSSASATVNEPNEVLGEFDGGQYLAMLARALGSVAASVVDNDRKGKITLELDFTRIKKTQQVSIKHSLKFSRPTMDGEASEKVSRETVMHVGRYGKLTIMPESQMELLPKGPTALPGA
ncbi:hypothetical protein [Comamonas thiooxydans]|uniref:hypothetical protein n=1 Tax=Comamonas thiooxydans TaxID=363952 RepID=UPI00050E4AFE|nr:hypothetical protein [Comamonas thiooxydans]KGH29252.1 hypothetical protein P606_02370 [Comamonas thiooxydans]